MPADMTEEEIRGLAERRVRSKRGFFSHLAIYLIVNAFLWFMGIVPALTGYGWGLRNPDFPWPAIITVFWGLGLLMHGLNVFVFHGGWEQNEINKEVERIKQQNK